MVTKKDTVKEKRAIYVLQELAKFHIADASDFMPDDVKNLATLANEYQALSQDAEFAPYLRKLEVKYPIPSNVKVLMRLVLTSPSTSEDKSWVHFLRSELDASQSPYVLQRLYLEQFKESITKDSRLIYKNVEDTKALIDNGMLDSHTMVYNADTNEMQEFHENVVYQGEKNKETAIDLNKRVAVLKRNIEKAAIYLYYMNYMGQQGDEPETVLSELSAQNPVLAQILYTRYYAIFDTELSLAGSLDTILKKYGYDPNFKKKDIFALSKEYNALLQAFKDAKLDAQNGLEIASYAREKFSPECEESYIRAQTLNKEALALIAKGEALFQALAEDPSKSQAVADYLTDKSIPKAVKQAVLLNVSESKPSVLLSFMENASEESVRQQIRGLLPQMAKERVDIEKGKILFNAVKWDGDVQPFVAYLQDKTISKRAKQTCLRNVVTGPSFYEAYQNTPALVSEVRRIAPVLDRQLIRYVEAMAGIKAGDITKAKAFLADKTILAGIKEGFIIVSKNMVSQTPSISGEQMAEMLSSVSGLGAEEQEHYLNDFYVFKTGVLSRFSTYLETGDLKPVLEFIKTSKCNQKSQVIEEIESRFAEQLVDGKYSTFLSEFEKLLPKGERVSADFKLVAQDLFTLFAKTGDYSKLRDFLLREDKLSLAELKEVVTYLQEKYPTEFENLRERNVAFDDRVKQILNQSKNDQSKAPLQIEPTAETAVPKDETPPLPEPVNGDPLNFVADKNTLIYERFVRAMGFMTDENIKFLNALSPKEFEDAWKRLERENPARADGFWNLYERGVNVPTHLAVKKVEQALASFAGHEPLLKFKALEKRNPTIYNQIVNALAQKDKRLAQIYQAMTYKWEVDDFGQLKNKRYHKEYGDDQRFISMYMYVADGNNIDMLYLKEIAPVQVYQMLYGNRQTALDWAYMLKNKLLNPDLPFEKKQEILNQLEANPIVIRDITRELTPDTRITSATLLNEIIHDPLLMVQPEQVQDEIVMLCLLNNNIEFETVYHMLDTYGQSSQEVQKKLAVLKQQDPVRYQKFAMYINEHHFEKTGVWDVLAYNVPESETSSVADIAQSTPQKTQQSDSQVTQDLIPQPFDAITSSSEAKPILFNQEEDFATPTNGLPQIDSTNTVAVTQNWIDFPLLKDEKISLRDKKNFLSSLQKNNPAVMTKLAVQMSMDNPQLAQDLEIYLPEWHRTKGGELLQDIVARLRQTEGSAGQKEKIETLTYLKEADIESFKVLEAYLRASHPDLIQEFALCFNDKPNQAIASTGDGVTITATNAPALQETQTSSDGLTITVKPEQADKALNTADGVVVSAENGGELVQNQPKNKDMSPSESVSATTSLTHQGHDITQSVDERPLVQQDRSRKTG